MFMAYFMGSFGRVHVRSLVAHPENGISGLDAVLADDGLTFEDVLADWLVANYLDNRSLPDGAVPARYLYPDHVVGPVSIDVEHDAYPVQRQSTVHQYAADYVELTGRGDVRIDFAGRTEARLVPADAHSGQYAWWSNRGDDSDATLTRTFDLRSLDAATLRAWMWYEIEEDWDYAYVEVSADGGQTWDVLPGPSTTMTDPNGNSFGPAYTGESSGWVEEVYDLSPYAGRQVLIRFEYVTDDAVNRAGWLIDDVRVPELGYGDDMESGSGEWLADGFVYSDNRVSQRYLLQLVTLGKEVRVLPVPVDAASQAQIEVYGLGSEIDSAVLIVAALAPATTEVAAYEYAIQPIE
jgi:immune inhibitor A